MALARVQDAGAVSNAVAYGSNNTAGNLLVAVIQVSADVTGVTDTAGNTWQKAVEEENGGGANYLEIWYVPNCASGANTVTAANSFGSSFCHIWVAEYSGADTSSPLDQTASDQNTTGDPDSGATSTTTQANELLVGGIANNGARTATWTEPDTEQYDDASAGASRALSAADEIVGSTGTYSATGTLSGSADWLAAVATFLEAGGGGAYTLTADAGSLTLAGQTAGLLYGYTLGAGAGSLTLAAQDASLEQGYVVTAGAGSLSIAGQDATLLRGYPLSAEAGSLTITGQTAALLYGHVLGAAPGTLSLSGQDATLEYSGFTAAPFPGATFGSTRGGNFGSTRGSHFGSARRGTFGR